MLAFTDEEIIEGVLAEFQPIANIPRPSGHEKAVSDYLKGLFESMGCQVVQDASNNIIADMAASAGKENVPLTIMQVHMDMVCVAEEGVEYDKFNDAIKLVRNGNFLTADGTSLGADDGIGIATIVFVMKNQKEHGPIRAIITVDEETGMSGAINLDEKWLKDAKYLLNCDSEDYDLLTVGSAGHLDAGWHGNIQWLDTPKGEAYTLTVSGLKGGHSGTEINSGVANAIKVLNHWLGTIDLNNVKFWLADINGGKARNVIPSKASATIVARSSLENLQRISRTCAKLFAESYGDLEPNAKFTVTPAAMPAKVFTRGFYNSLETLILDIPNGAMKMSELNPALVQTSANLGMITTTEDKVELVYMPRSTVDSDLDVMKGIVENLADGKNWQAEIEGTSPGWAERKDSELAKLMTGIFEKQNNKPMRVATIHAGLECSWHFKKNPDLDMVSIGTNNKDIHSPAETLELDTIPPQVQLIAETLAAM